MEQRDKKNLKAKTQDKPWNSVSLLAKAGKYYGNTPGDPSFHNHILVNNTYKIVRT